MLTISNSLETTTLSANQGVSDNGVLLHKQIGDGLCSKVFLASFKDPSFSKNLLQNNITSESHTDQNFAIKVIEKPEYKPLGIKEFQFLKHLPNHPNILKVFSYIAGGSLQRSNFTSLTSQIPNFQIDREFDYMSMEYCPNGDLFELLKRLGPISEHIAKSLFVQLLDGVEFLHTQAGVAHLDLKLENILVGSDYRIKLCDFGFVEDLKNKVTKSKGTDGYKAPELYFQNNDGFEGDKADIFALGVILFIMIFGVPPFTIASKENPYYRLFYRGDNTLKYFFRMHPTTKQKYINGEIDQDLMELLVALLDENPQKRPKNIDEIRKFAYLNKNNITVDQSLAETKQLVEKMNKNRLDQQ